MGYNILNASDINNVDFSQLDHDLNGVRWSNDKTLFVIESENLITPDGFIELMKNNEWNKLLI